LSYGQNLLTLANTFNSQISLVAPALLGIQSGLSHRIRHILKQKFNGRSCESSNIFPSLLFAAVLAVPFSALSIDLQQSELTSSIQTSSPIISASFPPNDSKEHDYLMAEFR
jgi:hypothetical protein